jgi:hypothetical protein
MYAPDAPPEPDQLPGPKDIWNPCLYHDRE